VVGFLAGFVLLRMVGLMEGDDGGKYGFKIYKKKRASPVS
jgi:hypothetical protein